MSEDAVDTCTPNNPSPVATPLSVNQDTAITFLSPMVATSPSTVDEHWDWRFFPLLFLPIELICKILALLPLKDRLRARVNRKMREIEANMTHALDELLIEFGGCYEVYGGINEVFINLSTKPSEILLEGLKKISKNCTFKLLLLESGTVGDEVLNFAISHFKAADIITDFATGPFGVLNRKRVEEIMEGRMTVGFNRIWCITAQFLLDIYEVMNDGFDSLHAVRLFVPAAIARKFLRTLGLGLNRDPEYVYQMVTTNRNLQLFYSCSSNGSFVFLLKNVIVFVEYGILTNHNGIGFVMFHRQNDDGTVTDCNERFPIKPFHLIQKDEVEIDYVQEFDKESDEE